MKRRDVIKLLSAAPIAGGLMGSAIQFESATAGEAAFDIVGRDLFKELGLNIY